MHGCVCIQGEYVSPQEAKISALDLGFLFGDGCFETLRTFGGRPFRLSAHLARLGHSAELLGIGPLPPSDILRAWALETCARAQMEESVLRITVTRGVLQQSGPPTVVMSALPLPILKPLTQGMAATFLWTRPNGELPSFSVKSTSYQRALLARQEAARRHAEEGLYGAKDDTLVEGATSNLFFVKDNRLITAPETLCLPGITRAEVLSLAEEMKLEVEFTALPRAHLAQVSECFVTSSLQGLRSVVEIDGQRIGQGTPGPIFSRLQEAYGVRTQQKEAP